METDIEAIAQPRILWLQVCSLAGLQGAITLTWVIYNLYLPLLFAEFGFPKSLAVGVLIVENALAVVMEPLMGGLSDKARYWIGSRFPFISVGVILSSALFIAIPSIATFSTASNGTRLLLLLVVIAWAIAMTVFRSPAISLLGRYATPAELPLAGSLVTLAGGIITALRPFASKYILGLGPIFTFAIGSFVLLAAAAALRFVNPPERPVDKAQTWATPGELPRALALILGTGIGVAWGSRFLMDALGKLLKVQWNTGNIDGIMFIISLVLALAALPAGAFATKIGNRKAMLSGISAIIIIMVIIISLGAQLPIVLLGVCAFSLIINGAVPFALTLVPPRWRGLGVGMYFAGFALTGSVFGVVFPQPQAITPVIGIIGGVLAFLVAGVCIFAASYGREVA
ncbi:MAG: SLC45 family MFS transporter [Scytonema sp. RU_4_4]|nr:SLC45 family MFS transporter [Scytonema sp. RU_4_4]NJR76637.1 SLC45 family MFS transporter [Scytonema sp. CRU_2_7]